MKYNAIHSTQNENYFLQEEVLHNALFVFEHGSMELIKKFSLAGASILLPNPAFGSHLLIQTIARRGKPFLVTNEKLWNEIKKELKNYPSIFNTIQVSILNAKKVGLQA